MKVSVIIPVYNAEKTIARCLEALTNQTFKDFEVICINDGSKDNSLQILKEYEQKDSRIKVFDQENSGPAKTRYIAIKKSSSEYLMFCDADDWYEQTMIEDMYSTIIEKNVDLVMCDCNVIDLSNGSIQTQNNQNYNKLKKAGLINIDTESTRYINALLWNKIFKKKILNEYNILYPQNYEHDDAIFVYKYCLVAKTYYGLNKTLYNYIVGNSNSIMGKVFTNTNKKNPYDFIYAWQDLYDYMKDHNVNQKWKKKYYQRIYGIVAKFYMYLNQEQKKTAFTIIKNFVKQNPELEIIKEFNAIANTDTIEDFAKIISGEKFQKISLLEYIFSITNIVEYKVIRIFGLKIKIKRKNI